METPPVTPAGDRPAGSLTEWLRQRADAELAELLRRRPDLGLPAPADLATLASRLGVRTSVQRAVDGLDAPALHALEALALVRDGDHAIRADHASELLPGLAPPGFDTAVAELTTLGLVWGPPHALHLVPAAADALGPYPAGLGRPAAVLLREVPDTQLAAVLRNMGLTPVGQPRAGAAVADVLADSARLAEMIAAVTPAEREVLDRLAAGPPIGTVRNAQLPTAWPAAEDVPPPHRLMMRGLLVPTGSQTVELPREVALALRSVPLGEVSASPPAIEVIQHDPAELDRRATTAALDALRLVERLADVWSEHAPAMLRTGGLGVRDLRRSARDLAVDEPVAALIIETAYAAGLIASTTGIDPVYLPSTDYDAWRGRDRSQRWTDLAGAWLAMSRQPSLVGQRGDRDRMITTLSPDAERGTVPALRARVLDVLLSVPPGATPARRADVLARLAWQSPRRATAQRGFAEAVLAEADILGLTAGSGLTGYSRTLLDGSRAGAQRALTAALPEEVGHFLIQPDLTVVVPGPPTAAVGGELALAADLESTGGAYVYRITERTVRRALDAGRSGAELARFLTERSRTAMPQALAYMIDDVARRHGALRSGTASAYLRCDDVGLLSRVLADRDVATLGLRRIAPTVLVSTAATSHVLEVLRHAGYAPAAEAPDGQLVTLRAESPRAAARAPVRAIRTRSGFDTAAETEELVRRIRSGDTLTELSHRLTPVVQQVPGVTSATTMALLRQAIREGRRVLLGHAEQDGTASRHTILPISLGGGFVRGHESQTKRLQSFPLHRLTAVSIIADDTDEDYSVDDSDDPA